MMFTSTKQFYIHQNQHHQKETNEIIICKYLKTIFLKTITK
jgi:hypothetical protein